MKKLVLIAMVFGLVLWTSGTVQAQAPAQAPCLPGIKAAPVEVVNPPSSPVPVTATVTSSPCCYHFVGYTADTTPPTLGIVGMNNLCQAAFHNPQARICNTLEWLNSPVTTYPKAAAWIQPYVVGGLYDPEAAPGLRDEIVDFTGLTAPSIQLNCLNWGTAGHGSHGLAVSEAFSGIGSFSCDYPAAQVTCCAP